MNKSNYRFEGISDKRMLSVEEASFYTGLGRNTCREWLRKIGAIRKIGRRVVCDRHVIDAALNQMDSVTA